MRIRALTAAVVLALLSAVSASAQTVVGQRMNITGTPPVITIDAGVVRQRPSGQSRYVSDWFVDAYSGETRLDAYDTTGDTLMPITLRASSVRLPDTTFRGLASFTTDADPVTPYTSNLGSLSNKYLTLHAAELWVETLVAQNTIATIGGRVLVAPTTELTEDLLAGYATHVEALSPQAFWRLGEAAGTTASDEMGTYDATYASSPTYGVAGPIADDTTAVSGGKATLGVGGGPSNANVVSVAFWFKGADNVDQFAAVGPYFRDPVGLRGWSIDKRGNSGANGELGVRIDTSAASNQVKTTTGHVWDDAWHFLVLILDDGTWTWYVDGALNASGSYLHGTGFADASATHYVYDAATYGNAVKDVAIFGRVLTADEIADLYAAAAITSNTITVKHNQMTSGDIAYLEANGKLEFVKMASGPSGSAGAYTYTVTRDLDGTGENDWFAGDALLNTGTTGDGFIDLYSYNGVVSDAVGPAIVGNVRTGTAYNDIAPRWAIGNLNGLYGYATDTYGTAFGVPTGAWIKIDPTNGVRIGYNATTHAYIDASGNAHFDGDVSATSGDLGGWTINSTYLAKDTGTNGTSAGLAPTDYPFFAGATYANRATAPFRVTPAGALIATNATISGNGSGLTSINGGNIQTGTVTATQIAANTITASKIAAGTITSTEIATGTIVSQNIGAGEIKAANIEAGAVTAGKIDVTSLSAISADLGTVTAGSINVSGGGGAFSMDTDGDTEVNNLTVDNFLQVNSTAILDNGGIFNNNIEITTGTLFIDDLAGGGTRSLCVNNSGLVTAC